MLVDRAEAMQRVCFDREPSEMDLELLGSPERWLVYRDLVRGRLIRVAQAAFPRTRCAVGDSVFQQLIDEWLSTGGPQTRYLRHVPNEVARVAARTWPSTLPPWVMDLLRYEDAVWAVWHAPPEPASIEPFAFDRTPQVRWAMRVLRLAHAVHRTPTPASGYAAEPTLLAVYRDAEHKPATRELNPLAADLLESWQRGEETVAESVERVAAAHDTRIGPAFVDKLAALVGEFLGGHALPS